MIYLGRGPSASFDSVGFPGCTKISGGLLTAASIKAVTNRWYLGETSTAAQVSSSTSFADSDIRCEWNEDRYDFAFGFA